jgi:hypothetical protein
MVSQLLTLYITPVIYIYLDQFMHWVSFRKRGRLPTLMADPVPQGK